MLAIAYMWQAFLACGIDQPWQKRLVARPKDCLWPQDHRLQSLRGCRVDAVFAQLLSPRVNRCEVARIGRVLRDKLLVAAIEDHARRRDIDQPPHAARQATGKHVRGSANVDIVEIDTPAPGRGERTGMADHLDTRAGSFYSHPIPYISRDGDGSSGNELLRPH